MNNMVRILATLFTLFILSIPTLAQSVLFDTSLFPSCDFHDSAVGESVANFVATQGEYVSLYLPDDSRAHRVWYWTDEQGQRVNEVNRIPLRVLYQTGRLHDPLFEIEDGQHYATGQMTASIHRPDIRFIQVYDHTARQDPDYPSGYHPCYSIAVRVDVPDEPVSDFPDYRKCLRLSTERDFAYVPDVNGFCTPGGEMYTGPYLKPWMIQPND